MSLIKEYIGPILIILAASALVVLAALPVANTDWAEGIRSDVGEAEEGAEGFSEGDEGAPPRVLLIVGPLIKVTILMGIGGGLTALVLWIIRLVSGRKPIPQKSH